MDDDRVWNLEKSLWVGDADHYRTLVDQECLMVLPSQPFVATGEQAISAVARTPKWTSVDISNGQISRPQEGLIVVAYRAIAHRDQGDDYVAYCTSTYRRLAHETWRVIQHQQTPPISGGARGS